MTGLSLIGLPVVKGALLEQIWPNEGRNADSGVYPVQVYPKQQWFCQSRVFDSGCKGMGGGWVGAGAGGRGGGVNLNPQEPKAVDINRFPHTNGHSKLLA